MGRHHADGSGFLLFNQGQSGFRIEFFKHDRLGAGYGSSKIGEGAGGTASVGCNGHGGVFVGKIPDIHPAFGGANTRGGWPFHQLGYTGGPRCGGQQGNIACWIQSALIQNIFINWL